MTSLHGAPDYYQYRRDSVTYPLADLAQLAARLGAVVSFDGRGDVAWIDSFEDALVHWSATGSPAGYTAISSALYAEHDGLSAELTPAGSGANQVELEHSLPYRALSLLGFEAWWMSMGDNDSVVLGLDLYAGGRVHSFEAKADIANSRLQVRTGSTTWSTIRSGVLIAEKETMFHRMKFVLDPVNLLYSRLLFNRFEDRDLAISPWDQAATSLEMITLRLQVNGSAGVDSPVYFDVVIHTWDEPA